MGVGQSADSVSDRSMTRRRMLEILNAVKKKLLVVYLDEYHEFTRVVYWMRNYSGLCLTTRLVIVVASLNGHSHRQRIDPRPSYTARIPNLANDDWSRFVSTTDSRNNYTIYTFCRSFDIFVLYASQSLPVYIRIGWFFFFGVLGYYALTSEHEYGFASHAERRWYLGNGRLRQSPSSR